MPRSESLKPSSLIESKTIKPYSKSATQANKNRNNTDKNVQQFVKVEDSHFTVQDNISASSDFHSDIPPSSSSSEEEEVSDYKPETVNKKDKEPNLRELEDEDDYQSDSDEEKEDKPKKKSRTNITTPTKRKTGGSSGKRSTSTTPRKSNGPKAVGRTWSAEEDWILFKELHPKSSKPDWNGVASKIGNGRDSKSCQNRYALISKKLEGAIKSIGGA
ncbi:uncharacterized protein L201_002061 [Kwoniella dendrophila CBS 6074]|uniref:Myb-like domain-containing protein n=1 Tax=Kwoniella dendrophila CBS 6074 TaxID=1295534 RepID=A0AAX4JP50_9TREE